MKKLFVLLLYILIVPTVTSAKSYLNYEWSIKQSDAANYLYYDETLEDKDGYVTISINQYNLGVMSKISKDGKEILWQLDNSFGLYYGLTMDDNYYYALFIGTVNEFVDQLYVARVNKQTGQINNEYVWLEEDDTIYDGEIYYYQGNIYVITRGDLGYYSGAKKIFTIDPNSFTVTNDRYYENVPKSEINAITDGHELYISDEEWYDIYPENYDYIIFSNQFNSNDYYYAVGEACESDNCYGFLLKIDKNKNVSWLRKNQNYYYFDASSPKDDYVAVLAYNDETHIGESSRNASKVQSYIIVYDENGNIVENHDVAKEIGVRNANLSHIISYGKYLLAQSFAYDEAGNYNSYLIRYNQYYTIKTDVQGNGQVKIDDEAFEGRNVTFETIPGENYVLEGLEIITSNGTTINVSGNSFIMPDDDVVVKAIFSTTITNPYTSQKLLPLGIVIMIICICISIVFVNKKSAFKNN